MKRRFIAGAICPECRVLDRIVMETEGDQGRRTCIECGFTEKLDTSADTGGSNLPASRLLRPAASAEIEASPVRLIDPKKLPPES